MHTIKEKAPIRLGGIIYTDVAPQTLAYKRLERLLNQHIELSHYGVAVEKLNFTFFAIPNHNGIPIEPAAYYHQEKRLDFQILLDFESTKKADELQFLKMIAASFVHALENAAKHATFPFLWSRFILDVKVLFSVHKWL